MLQKLRTQILDNGLPSILGGFYVFIYFAPIVGSWWMKSIVVIAADHCYSWWRLNKGFTHFVSLHMPAILCYLHSVLCNLRNIFFLEMCVLGLWQFWSFMGNQSQRYSSFGDRLSGVMTVSFRVQSPIWILIGFTSRVCVEFLRTESLHPRGLATQE
jgi:hypothetical protein